MRKTELNPAIVEWLSERLKGKTSQTTIRPSISKIARKDHSLTLNEAAAIRYYSILKFERTFFCSTDSC
jgi:hypothetical protein